MADQYDFEELYANTYTAADQSAYENEPVSQKRFVLAWALALFLGPVGTHRWYLQRPISAVIMVLVSLASMGLMLAELPTPGLLGITVVLAWTLIDVIMLLTGTMRDRAENRLAGHRERAGLCAAVTVVLVAFVLVAGLVVGSSVAVVS